MIEFDDGGIGLIELLHRTNIIALVGGGDRPKYPTNKVLLWDDKTGKFFAELEFRSPVLGLRMAADRYTNVLDDDCCRLVVVVKNKVFVYGITKESGVERLMVFDTFDNSRGIKCIAFVGVAAISGQTLAFPGKQKGHVQIVDIGDGKRLSTIIPAHTHAISALAVYVDPADGSEQIASASEKGTLIRVYDIDSGRKLHELRRGADQAEINCLAFSSKSPTNGGVGSRLAVSSDKGTVHIFTLGTKENKASEEVSADLRNRRSTYKHTHNIVTL